MTSTAWLDLVAEVLYYLATLAALRLWWRRRTRASAWVAAAFVDITVLLVAGRFIGDAAIVPTALLRLLLFVLFTFPYLLFRASAELVPVGRGLRTAAAVVAGAVALASAFAPRFPAPGEDPSTAVTVYLLGCLAGWMALTITTSLLLLRAGRGQPGVIRRRMRLLGAAAAAVGFALFIPLIISAGRAQPEDAQAPPPSVAEVAGSLLGAASAGLFLLAFAPPQVVRLWWRRREEARVYEAALDLMQADHPDAVHAVLLPGVRAVLGAPRVVLRDADGTLIAADPPRPQAADLPVRTVVVGDRRIEVETSRAMPLFGEDEQELVGRLGLLATLAEGRARLRASERAARAELEAANRELGSFVYTTSHDLKNPLITVLAYLDLLQSDHRDELSEEARHYVDRVVANANFMQALIQDLLELSRVGRVDVTPEPVDLAAVLTEIAADARRAHSELTVTWGALPTLWANPTRVRQLFSNVIDNAADYGGRPEVAVTVTAEPTTGGGVLITVADDGVGIPAEHLERVFGVFERLDGHAGHGGTGMGLAICRRIVEGLGGTMTARPDTAGAWIDIRLPADAVAADHAPTSSSTASGSDVSSTPVPGSRP